MTTVPNIVGLTATQAAAARNAVGLVAQGSGYNAAPPITHLVVSQTPPAGTSVEDGSGMTAIFSVTRQEYIASSIVSLGHVMSEIPQTPDEWRAYLATGAQYVRV